MTSTGEYQKGIVSSETEGHTDITGDSDPWTITGELIMGDYRRGHLMEILREPIGNLHWGLHPGLPHWRLTWGIIVNLHWGSFISEFTWRFTGDKPYLPQA